MHNKQIDLNLYFVTPEIGLDVKKWIDLVKEVAIGGANMVQIRDKVSSTRHIMNVIKKIHPLLKDLKIPLIINDRLDIALVSEVEGVHLGQKDFSVRQARNILGPNKIIGISIEKLHQIKTAIGADYAAASPVFATTTKKDAARPLGLKGLKILKERLNIPLVAIGGIRLEHLNELFINGADGVALITALSRAANPREVTEEFIKKIKILKNN